MAKNTLKQQAYDVIKGKIVNCEYMPNQMLTEEFLREEVGASRTPIRDALIRLEQENLVQILPKKGNVVAPLSIREITMIYDARLAIEPYAVLHYAGKIPDEVFLGYKERLSRPVTDLNKSYACDNELHRMFMDATENTYLMNAYEQIFAQSLRVRILVGVKSTHRLETTRQEHLKIIEACLDGAWEKAAQAMQNHMIESRKASFEAIIEKSDWDF